jgi:hypothetical protein
MVKVRSVGLVGSVLCLALGSFPSPSGGEDPASRVLAPEPTSVVNAPLAPSPACVDGVVKDDGVPETGYGWVPSVVEGVYVQEFDSGELDNRRLEKVCVCWLRTREDESVEFDLVLYRDVGGVPAMTPFAAIPAIATGVPTGVASGGSFYDVDLGGVTVPVGTFYAGVRWNPSVDQYFFLCVDKSPETPEVNGFYIDDRATEWGSVFGTPDPVFTGHRAMMVRVESFPGQPAELAIPDLSTGGAFALILALGLGGALLLATRLRA